MFDRFTVIPAIDLKDGRVVRLKRGAMETATVYGSDPAAVAREFERQGAELIHVVDLDGAVAGAPRNLEAIAKIRAAVKTAIDVGGGLRNLESIRAAFGSGADRVSIGTAAMRKPGLIEAAAKEFRGRIFGSVDAREGRVAIDGWVQTSSLTISDAIARFHDAGVDAVTITDITRDGVLTGVDAEAMADHARDGGVRVIASGGVATLEDIRKLSLKFREGVVGVIVGRALYERKFELAAAIRIATATDER